MAVELEVKKWGNSLAVVLPSELTSKKNLSAHDKISVEIVKSADLRNIFGSLKFKKSAQQIKDELRSGWN